MLVLVWCNNNNQKNKSMLKGVLLQEIACGFYKYEIHFHFLHSSCNQFINPPFADGIRLVKHPKPFVQNG